MKEKLQRFAQWWEGKNHDRPLVDLVVAAKDPPDLNRFWPTPTAEPDYDGFVTQQLRWLEGVRHLGDSIPCLAHMWGQRGTPMTMAAYLGGRVRFGDTTVWVEPVVDDWKDFEIRFDPGNRWVQRSRRLLETHVKRCPAGCLPLLPDLGDALTVFSLLRGSERLLFDVLEQPEVIDRKVREYVAAWIEAHRYFWDLYRSRFAGDASCFGWAPGRTYVCQCDFSTMISPALFRRFVAPELTQLAGYLEYMCWHLDGPEEIKHLDALLELPQVRLIQVQPGSNRPPCVSDLWLPRIRKIQAQGRGVIVDVNTPAELETLLSQLAPAGLRIAITGPLVDPAETAPFLEIFKRRYGHNPWS